MGNKVTLANTLKGDLWFGYDQMHSTHQPRTMFDWGSGREMEFFWDANGNLAQVIGCVQNLGRLHEWDVKRNSRTEKSPVDSSRSKCGARVCQSKHRTQLDRLRFVLGGNYKGAWDDYNAFKIVSMLGTNIEGYKKTGVTEANYKISVVDAYKEETTAAHEVGHTLMNVQGGKESEHTPTGVMTKSISDKGRSASVSQETVNSIVESNGFKQNPTLWQRIRSWFD